MVQMRLAGGSSGAGGRSWKPFSLALWLGKDNYGLYCGQTETTALPSMLCGYLLGLCLLLLSLGSSSSSVESAGEGAAVLSSKCSCWDRYCAGVCLAARAQCSSSLCNNGRFA